MAGGQLFGVAHKLKARIHRVAQHIGQVVQVQRGQVPGAVGLAQGTKSPTDRVARAIVFIGVKLGAGGLVRAYTDAVAQALLSAEKVPLIVQTTLACSLPYALEGLVRRELELAQAPLLGVSHGSVVTLRFALPQSQVAEWVARLSESGRGQLVWLEGDSAP